MNKNLGCGIFTITDMGIFTISQTLKSHFLLNDKIRVINHEIISVFAVLKTLVMSNCYILKKKQLMKSCFSSISHGNGKENISVSANHISEKKTLTINSHLKN